MKRTQFVIGMMALAFALGSRAKAQLPSGTNENTAIPLYFQEMYNDMIDVKTAPLRVFSLTLSKGQQISATMSLAPTAPSVNLEIQLWGPGQTNLGNCSYGGCSGQLAGGAVGNTRSASIQSYTASVSGVFYITVASNGESVNYTIDVTTPTPPVPPSCTGGNLSGQVDYITYSVALIGAELPDSASIGGTALCSTCSVKAPQYPQIAEKLQIAMSLNVPVSVCYDGSGNIQQITLKHP